LLFLSIASSIELWGSSTAGSHETATKRSLFDKRDEGSRRRRALGV
jgi:hypothetical protein